MISNAVLASTIVGQNSYDLDSFQIAEGLVHGLASFMCHIAKPGKQRFAVLHAVELLMQYTNENHPLMKDAEPLVKN